jgi:hypothetical protein
MTILNFNIGWNYKGKTGTYTVWHEGFKREMANWTKAWTRIISEVLVPFVQSQFRSQGGEGERPWAELAPSTLKRRLFPGKPILQQTGMLQMSFIGGPEHIEQVEPKRMRWGSESNVAVFHQTGTGVKFLDRTARAYDAKGKPTMPGRGMPQRPILDFYWLKVEAMGKALNPWNKKMQNIVRWELREASRRAGFGIAKVKPGPGAGAEALRIGDVLLGNI